MTISIKSPVFSITDRGFKADAYYLQKPNDGDCLVEIRKDGEPYRRFLFPAYKVWNIAAHFSNIVDGEIAGNLCGYDLAGWSGFSVVSIAQLPEDAEVIR